MSSQDQNSLTPTSPTEKLAKISEKKVEFKIFTVRRFYKTLFSTNIHFF